ncbi:unnamed protein product [Orchesella dallaii]|uniref:Uncharacterized protein n=1 Tax=Orchesella dallaii TaxID=48710 RepID=A0ABP1PVB3_9HEXA
MEIIQQTWVSLSFNVILLCILGSISFPASCRVSATTSEFPTKYSSLILQSSNSPNFTFSSETGPDIKGTSQENVSWETKAFQVANISTLLTNYQAIPYPPLNDSRFFISKDVASLIVKIKNFKGYLLYLNFSYYIGVNAKLRTEQLASNPRPKSISSKKENEVFKPNKNEKEESKKLSVEITTEQDTILLANSIVDAMTQHILPANKRKQQENKQQQATLKTETPKSLSQLHHASSTTTNFIHPSSMPNGTVSKSPVANPVESHAALYQNIRIREMKSIVSANQDSDNFSKKIPMTKDTPKENVPLKDNVKKVDVTTKDPNTEPDPQLEEPEARIMTQDVARKKRSIKFSENVSVRIQPTNNNAELENASGGNDNVVHKETPSSGSDVKISNVGEASTGTDTANAKENSQITSNDSLPSLPLHLETLIKSAAAVIAAAAISAQKAAYKDSPISKAQMAMPHDLPGDEQKPFTPAPGSAPIKETDSSSLSLLTKPAATATVKTEDVIRKMSFDHPEHYHNISKSNPASENDSVGTKVNDKDDSSSSNRSEMFHAHGGGAKQKKLPYKTWRASLEKRNRPLGLFVTVNDNIIFDNWEGIWDRPRVLGRWTGSLKDGSKNKWIQTHISTSWEEATEHDIQIAFEWEPVEENAVVILSDIIVSTISVPQTATCGEPKVESPTKEEDAKIGTQNLSKQNKLPAIINAKTNDTIDAINDFQNVSSTSHDIKKYPLQDPVLERHVSKTMHKIGNDDMEAERVAHHEIMKNLVAKARNDSTFENTLRKLAYNMKQALHLLHAQNVRNENVSISTQKPNISAEISTVSTTTSTSTEASTTTMMYSTSPTTLLTSTTSTTPPSTMTSPATTPQTSFPTTPLSSTQTPAPTTIATDADWKESSSISTTVPPPVESSLILGNESVSNRSLEISSGESKKNGESVLLIVIYVGVMGGGFLTFLLWKHMRVKKESNAPRSIQLATF